MKKKVVAGFNEALAHAKRDSGGGASAWSPPTSTEIKALRQTLNLTQLEFANRFGFDLTSVRNWEQDRAAPERTKAIYLRMIEVGPREVLKLLDKVRSRTVSKKSSRSKELA